MKTPEESNNVKKEDEIMNRQDTELNDDELKQVSGGIMQYILKADEKDEQIIGGTNILSVTPSSKNLA